MSQAAGSQTLNPSPSPSPSPSASALSAARIAVLDTNIVLDLFLFQDPHCAALRQALESGQLRWIATPHMRNELERVLTYAYIAAKLSFYKKSPADILAHFDRHTQLHTAPTQKAPYICKDADDQVFIDLAHTLALDGGAINARSAPPITLHSKDKAVLCMRKRLEKLSIHVSVPKTV